MADRGDEGILVHPQEGVGRRLAGQRHIRDRLPGQLGIGRELRHARNAIAGRDRGVAADEGLVVFGFHPGQRGTPGQVAGELRLGGEFDARKVEEVRSAMAEGRFKGLVNGVLRN